MANIDKHTINCNEPLTVALRMLNSLGTELTLFVVNEKKELLGAVTDGDIRRGLLNDLETTDEISKFMQGEFHFLQHNQQNVKDIAKAKKKGIQMLPVINEKKHIIRIIDFNFHKSVLPLDVVIMAGGEGVRLRPLTDQLPKPLLKIGNKPIIEHGIDRLIQFGIENITISINYLGDKIIEYFGNGERKNIQINYIRETQKLGTAGSISLISDFRNDHVLVMNSDLLTNIDLESFFNEYEEKNADMSIACVPYTVNVPYAILDIDNDNVLSLKEKPTFSYYSNAGIYLIRKEHIKKIPKDTYFNATDLIDMLIAEGKRVTHYPLLEYWLDIGNMSDFNKGQNDIKHIKF